MTPERFTIAIPDDRLNEMKRRLRATAWPGDFGNDDWRFGVPEPWLRDMVDYWANDYDWRAAEARFNASMQISNSIKLSFAGAAVGWTTKTSSPRTFSCTSTKISSSAKRRTDADVSCLSR